MANELDRLRTEDPETYEYLFGSGAPEGELRERLRTLWEKHDAHPVGHDMQPRWSETGRISDLLTDVEALVREEVEADRRARRLRP